MLQLLNQMLTFMDILKVAIKIKASFFQFSSSGSLESGLYPTGKDLIA